MQAGKTNSSQTRVIGQRPKGPMSAYSASAPVTARTTAGREKNATVKCPNRKPRAELGDRAFTSAGGTAIPCAPIAPIAVNHTAMTGPNSRPTAPVPSRCSKNRPTMITAVIGTTSSSTDGAATLTPSIAESTEIAGVMMLSPKNSDAPKIPSAASTAFARRPPGAPRLRISVMSAMIPPSPSLSARITSRTYVTVTMIVTDQKISETTPKTFSLDTGTGCGSPGLKTVWTVYSGLVPMSPKTTPRPPGASAPRAATCRFTVTVSCPSAHTNPWRTTLTNGTAESVNHDPLAARHPGGVTLTRS